MLTKGLKILKVADIQISIDYSWFIVFALFAWSLGAGYFPVKNPGYDMTTYAVMGILSSFFIFVSVLIHELSHSMTANRLGLDVHEVTLFIFGGVANLTREPDDPMEELKIAIAGPLASGVLAFIFISSASFLEELLVSPLVVSVVRLLGTMNLVLLIFNMIPGFPLDGGRVFRAIWWKFSGNLQEATRVSSQVGRAFGLFIMILGFIQLANKNIVGGLWSIFIGLFLQQAAITGYRQRVIQDTLGKISVREIMTKDVVTITEEETISKVVDESFFGRHHSGFPVVRGGHILAGLLTLDDIRAIPHSDWPTVRVGSIMTRLGSHNAGDFTLSPDDHVDEVLNKMIAKDRSIFPVLEGGVLVGILTRHDIMKTMEFRAKLGERRPTDTV